MLTTPACQGSPGRAPEAARADAASRGAGTPIGRSPHPRSGRFSYRLAAVVRQGDGVRVELRLSNGTKRDYVSVVVRVVVLGPAGQRASLRVPVGAMGADRTRPVRAWLADVPFRVRDVAVELIYAAP